VIQKADALRPIKAPEIRKVVKKALADQFAARAEKSVGGEWKYHGASEGQGFTVSIDYGGMGDQLRYGVLFEDEASGFRAHGLTYEGMLGLGLGRWDYLTADNVAECVDLLCGFIKDLVSIPERIQQPGNGTR
jgi:hypothetical protein